MTRLFTTIALLVSTWTVATAQDVDFKSQIKPILEKHCIACHGPTREENFRIDDRDVAIDFVLEGDSENSDLYDVLISDDEDVKMPPPGSHEPLAESDIQLVKTWIDQGANWPEDVGDWEDIPLPASKPDDDQIELVKRATGSLHPAAIHLPIGLLLAAGLFAFLSLRGNFVMSDCAYYCLWLGALGAIGACVSGWFFSEMRGWGEVNELADVLNSEKKIYWHRLTGLIAAFCAVILALFAASARNKDPDDGIMWKLGCMLLAAGIGFVGHKGGELTYGEGHYQHVDALYESFFPQAKEDGDRTIDETKEEPADEDKVESLDQAT